jgi:hypothetical protein
MAFPSSPTNNEEYTTPLGITYRYSQSNDKWLIVSQEVLGNQGVTGLLGLTGPTGPTGPLGVPPDLVLNSLSVTGDHGGTGLFVSNILYGLTGPPSPTGIPNGTLFFKYTI